MEKDSTSIHRRLYSDYRFITLWPGRTGSLLPLEKVAPKGPEEVLGREDRLDLVTWEERRSGVTRTLKRRVAGQGTNTWHILFRQAP